MDRAFHDTLRLGIEAARLQVPGDALPLLERFADRLLAWNRKVNLTRITAPAEVAEKHVVDSLLLLPFVERARTLLDVGSGAGLPGVPLACVRRDLEVTCCDSVAKKVAFVKAVAADLDVNVRGVAVRAAGEPEREGLPRAEAVVSRALSDPAEWVPLGARYLSQGGVLLAMLGRLADRHRLEEIGRASGLVLERLEAYELPVSGSARAIASWRRG
ncbi:MAG TPA: 16S rRNA (guanine(527)-N(7))-methyltransferase RsmG [Anaeromyxobacter sp.]